jgi:hypothetical protein
MKGQFCEFNSKTFCQESSGCGNCEIARTTVCFKHFTVYHKDTECPNCMQEQDAAMEAKRESQQ